MSHIKQAFIIDDDQVSGFIAVSSLEQINATIKTFSFENSKQALEYLKTNCSPTSALDVSCFPDLILLDLKMPVMDGYEFLEEYAKLEGVKAKNTSIIILSSAPYYKERERIEEFNYLGYIEKPATQEKIQAILDMRRITI